MSKRFIKVAIDGPAGVGKSTISSQLAKKYNFVPFNTGIIYRSAAYYCKKQKIDINNDEAVYREVCELVDEAGIFVSFKKGKPQLYIDGNPVDLKNLFGLGIDEYVSPLAANLKARKRLVELQKSVIEAVKDEGHKGIIIEGRDINTVIAPDAQVKIFLTASAEARAKRRQEQLSRDEKIDVVKNAIERRDKRDSETAERLGNVLPDDVKIVDSSDMTVEETTDKISRLIDKAKEADCGR